MYTVLISTWEAFAPLLYAYILSASFFEKISPPAPQAIGGAVGEALRSERSNNGVVARVAISKDAVVASFNIREPNDNYNTRYHHPAQVSTRFASSKPCAPPIACGARGEIFAN